MDNSQDTIAVVTDLGIGAISETSHVKRLAASKNKAVDFVRENKNMILATAAIGLAGLIYFKKIKL